MILFDLLVIRFSSCFFQMLNIYSSSVTVLIGLICLRWLHRRLVTSRQQSIASQRAQSKRQARDQRREELLQLLRSKLPEHLPDRAITELISHSTGSELLQGLRERKFTSTQVVLVFSLRALKIGQRICCTTEEFFDQALEWARRLDGERREDDEHLLQGIPISLKDQINQQGADSSMSIAMRNFRPALADGLLLQLLKEQGAFAGFVRTATVQGMMLPDTQSVTYGVADNPFNRARTTGGSSGRQRPVSRTHTSSHLSARWWRCADCFSRISNWHRYRYRRQHSDSGSFQWHLRLQTHARSPNRDGHCCARSSRWRRRDEHPSHCRSIGSVHRRSRSGHACIASRGDVAQWSSIGKTTVARRTFQRTEKTHHWVLHGRSVVRPGARLYSGGQWSCRSAAKTWPSSDSLRANWYAWGRASIHWHYSSWWVSSFSWIAGKRSCRSSLHTSSASSDLATIPSSMGRPNTAIDRWTTERLGCRILWCENDLRILRLNHWFEKVYQTVAGWHEEERSRSSPGKKR